MHEGHRQRMFERLEGDGKLEDHELLEILLFYSLPRVNTNEIAHNLLDSFGDLSSVFDADVQKIKTVDGVGEKTARYLFLIGKLIKRISAAQPDDLPYAYSYESFSDFLKQRYRSVQQEYAEIFAVKKNGELIHCRKFTSEELFRVDIPASEISAFIASFHPHDVILVHNHICGSPNPSKEDEFFTKKFCLYLDLCGIRLLDHYIVSPGGVYSFMREGRMEEIYRTCSAQNILKRLT